MKTIRKNCKNLTIVFFMVTFLFTILLASVAFGSEAKVIKIAFPLAPGTISDLCLKSYKQIVENKIGDKVEIQLFPSGQLGKDVAVLEGLRLGTHDATLVATTISTVEPKFSFLDLPYLFTSREDVEKISKGSIGKKLIAGVEEKGIKELAMWNSGWRHVTNNIRPINTPDDLNGLKIRTPSSPSRVKLFKLLGANPTPLSFGELFSALQQGVVDGQENPIYVVTTSKLYEVQKYLSLTKHVYTSNHLLFSKELWDSFSPEIQNVLQDAAYEVQDKSWEIYDELEKEALKKISEVMMVNEVDMTKFKEIAQPIYEDPSIIGPIGEDLIKEVLETLGKI